MNDQHVTALEAAHERATQRAADPAVAEEHKHMWETIASIAYVVLQVLGSQKR